MNKSETIKSIIVFDEPELEFRYEQRMADPRDGLSLFGPFDADLPSVPGTVILCRYRNGRRNLSV